MKKKDQHQAGTVHREQICTNIEDVLFLRKQHQYRIDPFRICVELY